LDVRNGLARVGEEEVANDRVIGEIVEYEARRSRGGGEAVVQLPAQRRVQRSVDEVVGGGHADLVVCLREILRLEIVHGARRPADHLVVLGVV
jgi:hypothetical protein